MATKTQADWRDNHTVGDYHAVMRHEFRDRQGCEPRLTGFDDDQTEYVGSQLEAEHDLVLLIFARDKALRAMAAAAADVLQERLPANCAYLPPEYVTRHKQCHLLRALCGRDYAAESVGYITVAGAFSALAAAR